MDKIWVCNRFKNSKNLIDITLNHFLLQLLKVIFLKYKNSNRNRDIIKKLNSFLEKINNNIIKNKDNYIKIENGNEKENLNNIYKFVKMQNEKYAHEILKNLLIIVFSFRFKVEKEKTFGKYLYNNMNNLRNQKKFDLANWFIQDKFNINLGVLLENDIKKNEEEEMNEIQKQPIFYFLYLLDPKPDTEKNNILLKYINRGIYVKKNIKNQDNDETISSSNVTYSISYMKSNAFYSQILGKTSRATRIMFIRSLFISVYIYSQNKNSPLMKYINKTDNELESIPFEFNLSEAIIEDKYSSIVLSPLRIEPRVSVIKMIKNLIKDEGFSELSKILIFNNKSIKEINFNTCMIHSKDIGFFNCGIFDNYSVEELKLSYNCLNEDADEYLANILSHLKNLKSINLSFNDLKRGISSFLILLKDLYREGKTKLENLNLIDCELDNIAFYELGELLKCKHCKLKRLYLNKNKIPYTVNFLKKLKKNKSLTKIYFNDSNIGNNCTNDIMRIISNTYIEELYLFHNKFINIDHCLRIIYRTKLITIKEEKNNKIFKNESFFYNLDIGKNYHCNNKNIIKIELIKKIFDNMTLHCLDMSYILFGADANNYRKQNSSLNRLYIQSVDLLTESLKEKNKEYQQAVENLDCINKDINKIKDKIKNEELFKKINISNIINDKNAQYPVFIKEKAKELIINDEGIKKEFKNDNIVDKQKYKEIYDDFINYITLQRDLKNKAKYEEIKNKKKMIII